jgi:hypothetical protein
MTTIKMTEAAAKLIAHERETLEREIRDYENAMTALFDAIRLGDIPTLWRAVNLACDAEYELTGGDGPAGLYHGTLQIPDCYEPGEPCANYDGSPHCINKCGLRFYLHDSSDGTGVASVKST